MMIVSRPIILGVAVFVTLSSALVDHDGWEFYGGQRQRHKHGLNRATSDVAPRSTNGNIKFDIAPQPEDPDLLITNDEAPPPAKHVAVATSSNSRWRDKEKILLLPDRYSVLSFDSQEDSTETSSFWGRFYAEGAPNHIQYLRAHFGSDTVWGNVKLMLAEPLNMCDELSGLPVLHNANEIKNATTDSYVVIVAMRGECTFGEKALLAAEQSHGIIFVNNEDGLFHPSGPEASVLRRFSATMIGQDDGRHLIQALSSGHGSLNGRFVPIMCNSALNGKHCDELHQDDKTFVVSFSYTGKIYTDDDVEFDYIQGDFGGWLSDPHSHVEFQTMVPSVIGGDANCCDKSGFVGNQVSNNTAMLCLRGECDFASKAEIVELSGAGMMIVSSYNITRMGCDPPMRGRRINVASVMVTNETYEELVSSYYSNLDSGLLSTIRLNNKQDKVCKDVDAFD